MSNLPSDFVNRMRKILKEDFPLFFESYSHPPQKAVRVNTLKISVEDFKEISPVNLEEPVLWEESGFYTSDLNLGKTVEHAAGLYYVQEPSAMSVALKLEVKDGERVLDLCSAPGGKGTQIAQRLKNGIIYLNEINFSRAKILSSNVERLGIKNAAVTCASPEKLSRCFENVFDKILIDAPCSGEGMFRKEPAAIGEWSVENVKMCAKRQSEILACAYKMLAGGGKIVYSTCTFAPEEDELQVSGFAAKFGLNVSETKKLYPHKIRGEGHFYAVIEKTDGEKREPDFFNPQFKDKKLLSVYRNWETENLFTSFRNLHLSGNILYSLPDDAFSGDIQYLRTGVRLGEFINGRFEPSHSLAMCLKSSEAHGIEVDGSTAISYLRGLTFPCTGNGYNLVLYKGYPLGWCKASGGTAKNKLPKGIRI